MRSLWLLPLLCAACRSDPPAPAEAPAASGPIDAGVDWKADRDTTPLPGAPALAAIAGWWVVVDGFDSGNNDPGSKGSAAWWFGPDVVRLLVGDANDRRPIERTRVDGDALRLELEGSDVLVTRRRSGIAIHMSDESTFVPLRRATAAEAKAIGAAEAKRGRMLERACEKALECCTAARGLGIAKPEDCAPLLGKPDLSMCIQAVATFKNKAAAANKTIPQCLPDK